MSVLVPLGLDQAHFEVALEELLHRRVARGEDLLGGPHGADLRLPQQRHPVRHPERAAHVVRPHHARHAQRGPFTIPATESGLSSALITFRVTLFPTPEGPSSATVSPSCTSRLTPSSTTFERKRLEMFWSWIISHRATASW